MKEPVVNPFADLPGPSPHLYYKTLFAHWMAGTMVLQDRIQQVHAKNLSLREQLRVMNVKITTEQMTMRKTMVEQAPRKPVPQQATPMGPPESGQQSSHSYASFRKGRKRYRRLASEIERNFHCWVDTCPKAYGSEGSLH